jgi:hypothetical protein
MHHFSELGDDDFVYARSMLTGPARESEPALEAIQMIASALKILRAHDGDPAAGSIHWRLRDALDLLAHGERRHSFERPPTDPLKTVDEFQALL